MEDAVGDGADGKEREDKDEEGEKEREKDVGEDGLLLMMMGMKMKKVGAEEDSGIVGGVMGEEVEKGWVDDEGEREREEEEDGESEEVARVSIEDALRFGEDRAEVQTRRWGCHARIKLIF